MAKKTTKRKPKTAAADAASPEAVPSAKLTAADPLPDDVVELFTKYQRYLTAGKANYGRADKALEAILQRCEPGVEYVLPAKGKRPPIRLALVDQFAATNVVWAGSGCKRMKITETAVKPQDRA